MNRKELADQVGRLGESIEQKDEESSAVATVLFFTAGILQEGTTEDVILLTMMLRHFGETHCEAIRTRIREDTHEAG